MPAERPGPLAAPATRITIRDWTRADFVAIQALSHAAGWPTPVDRPAAVLAAWERSWPALVAVADEEAIGFLRALSDGEVTTYVAELLVTPAWRGHGVGRALLAACRARVPGTRLDLLATSSSVDFYRHLGFRDFPGFRRGAAPGLES